MSPEKQKLLDLEQTEEYVFHGSEQNLSTLSPQQAIDTVKGPDGLPAIFASDVADYAIFMAIINKQNCPLGSRSRAGADGREMHLGTTQKTLDQLQASASGFVYVFPRSLFTKRDEGGVEYVRYTHAEPIMKIKVGKQDLPKDIVIFEEDVS